MSTKKGKFSKKDKKYMELALSLANSRHGLTGVNPSVGCVIVKDNKIISIGQTGYGGTPHAEYNAINSSNTNLEGSKIYITLEPCNHYGKTPPCTNLIIKKKINEVFYSIEDVDKKVKGKSSKILKSKKILVKKGLLKDQVRKFYSTYFFNRIKKVPFVTGKIATSKNNLIYTKDTKKITDIHSDKLTHFLRYKNDSIMISYKTLNLEPLRDKFKAFGWRVIISDGHHHTKIKKALSFSIKSKIRPTVVIFNTIKGKGVKFMENKILWHYRVPQNKEYNSAINLLLND